MGTTDCSPAVPAATSNRVRIIHWIEDNIYLLVVNNHKVTSLVAMSGQSLIHLIVTTHY